MEPQQLPSSAPSRVIRAGRVVKRRRVQAPAADNDRTTTEASKRRPREETGRESEEPAGDQSMAGSQAATAPVSEEDLFGAAELSDTVSALRLLAARLHGNGPFAGCPIILRHQLYTILEDATGVDMELERLRRENHLRMIKLHPGDVGLIETATYNTRITTAIQNASSEARREALVVLREVVGQVTNLSVSMEEVAGQYRPRAKEKALASSAKAKRDAPAAAADRSRSNSPSQEEEQEEVRLLLQELVRAGFLVPRREAGQQVFWFSAPESGRIAASIPRGRQAILAAIQRSRYKEVLDRNLQSLKPRGPKSELPVAFHVADLVGSGDILPVATAAGTFYRLKA